jgi:hypothetical protein
MIRNIYITNLIMEYIKGNNKTYDADIMDEDELEKFIQSEADKYKKILMLISLTDFTKLISDITQCDTCEYVNKHECLTDIFRYSGTICAMVAVFGERGTDSSMMDDLCRILVLCTRNINTREFIDLREIVHEFMNDVDDEKN